MRKIILLKFFVISIFYLNFQRVTAAQPLPSPAPSPREAHAIRVLIYGAQLSPDPVTLNAVRSLIGSMVANLRIKTYKVYGWGPEGGFDACIVPHYPQSWALDEIYSELLTIQANERTTVYRVTKVASCDE